MKIRRETIASFCISRTILIILLSFLFSSLINGQNGAPLLTNFRESNEPENQNWAICQDDNNVMLFANRRGILTFDGQSWGFVQIPTVPYSLKYNALARRVFVGGENNYGYLERDDMGIYKYFSLSGDSASAGLISKILFTDSTVVFYSEQCISRHNLKTGKLSLRLRQLEGKPFTGMFFTPHETYINVMSLGLYRLQDEALFPVQSGSQTKNIEVLFGLPYDSVNVLVGKGNGELSLFDGSDYYEYPVNDEGYLRQNILSEGLVISDSLYAFSTLEGGAMVVSRKDGRLRYTISYVNGLPDDEIFAMGSDNSDGLWLSHQYGLTRADLNLPIANFSIYPGLKGNLISSVWHNNELYIATSEGVFYLKEVKNFEEVEILVRDKKSSSSSSGASISNRPLRLNLPEMQKTRKSIFSQVFGKKPPSGNIVEIDTINRQKAEEQVIITPPALKLPEPRHFRKVAGRLKSVNYIFRKVDGLNEKCKQLVPAGRELLASTNKGLYVINDHRAKAVIGSGYINLISSKTNDNKYYLATSEGYLYITKDDRNEWTAVYPDKSFTRPVYSAVLTKDNDLWLGVDDAAYRIKMDGDQPERPVVYSIKNNLPQRYTVEYVNDTVFILMMSKVSYYDKATDVFREYTKRIGDGNTKLRYILNQTDIPWIKTEDGWCSLSDKEGIDYDEKALLRIFDNMSSIFTDDNNIWIVNGDNNLFRIERNRMPSDKPVIGLFIRSISNSKGNNFKLTDIVFGRGDNTLYFEPVAPGYLKQNSAQYQYRVDAVMNTWSKWSYNNMITLMIKPGHYTLNVRAKDIWGNISEPRRIDFSIEAPFTQKRVFYVLVIGGVLIIVIAVILIRERQLKLDKRILEKRVTERTARIEAQKQEITSSIEYASRIQRAMLPEADHFIRLFADYFIIFKPRDIVSGDFYWIGEDDTRIYFTVADCTGHGVPGAFMSTLGISMLDEIVTNSPGLKANMVLNILREKIKTSLHQTGKPGEATDGLDIAFCVLHKNRKKLEFSGAYNSMVIFQNGQLHEYRADRMPIGIYYGEKDTFTNYEIDVNEGDTVYIFTDGFADQFGGPKATKYMKYNLKNLLTELTHLPMHQQRIMLENEFQKWKGSLGQIDDVTIMGIRI